MSLVRPVYLALVSVSEKIPMVAYSPIRNVFTISRHSNTGRIGSQYDKKPGAQGSVLPPEWIIIGLWGANMAVMHPRMGFS